MEAGGWGGVGWSGMGGQGQGPCLLTSQRTSLGIPGTTAGNTEIIQGAEGRRSLIQVDFHMDG